VSHAGYGPVYPQALKPGYGPEYKPTHPNSEGMKVPQGKE